MFSKTKKNQRRNNRRPLRTESLETRKLMAGDVLVEFTGGDLKITGDDSANEIRLVEVGESLEVRGVGTTQINGNNAPFSIPTAAIDDVMIETGRGDDNVQIQNVDLGNPDLPILAGANVSNLNIELGRGDNRLEIDNVFVEGDLRVDATPWRAGDNTINLNNVLSLYDIKVWTGSGDDQVTLANATAVDDIRVGTAGGDDIVFVTNASANDNVSIDSGSDDDTIVVSGTSAEDLYVVGNRGDDVIVLNDLAILDLVRVDSGRGDDLSLIHI